MCSQYINMTLLILHVNQGEWDRSTPNHEGGGTFHFQQGHNLAQVWQCGGGGYFWGGGQGPRDTVYVSQRARGGGKVSRSGGKGHVLELGWMGSGTS